LFELLPKVAYIEKEECNAVLAEWVEGLGEFKSDEKRLREEIADNDYTSPADWGWLADEELLGVELSELLQDLRWAKRVKPSRYARILRWRRQVDFRAESGTGPIFSSDIGYNLLTLFRLWNMAEYYFPSVNITDNKWSDVLCEFIPKFLHTDNVKWTTVELIAELGDTHSAMSNNPIYSARVLPVELKFIEGKLVVTDNRKFLATDGEPVFALGDEIISIEGHTPDYFIDRARRYIAASNENVLLRDAAQLASYVSGEKTMVVIERSGKRIELASLTIDLENYYKRVDEWNKAKDCYKLLNDSTGYLYAGKYRREDAAAIMSTLKDTKAIIIDMRCYPSGFMPSAFTGRYFVPQSTPFVVMTRPVKELPGYYRENINSLGNKNEDYYKGVVVVLVNEITQSSAEYQTMAFQAAPNCVVVGSRTAGADGNVSHITLPRNITTLFSGFGVYYPDGTNTQRAGIRIDYYVEPTIEGIRQGRDEVLEKALEIIESRLQ
jgi:C-terminal processing protease CtpA/Prc